MSKHIKSQTTHHTLPFISIYCTIATEDFLFNSGKTIFCVFQSGDNFINILMQSIYTQISKKRKKGNQVITFFLLLGSLSIKAVCKMLVKLNSPIFSVLLVLIVLVTPGVNFINILFKTFSYKSAFRSFSLITVWL